MSERLKTLAGALLALMVIYGLFLNRSDDAGYITRPLTTEKGLNGYYALDQWLADQNIRTYSLRERFTSVIDNPDIASPTGNILVTTLPYLKPLRATENFTLQEWISRGNTLLILAGLNDTPDWSVGRTLFEDLDSLTGISFYTLEEDSPEDKAEADPTGSQPEEADSDEPDSGLDEELQDWMKVFNNSGVEQQYKIKPGPGHPLMRGISTMTAMSSFSSFVLVPEVDDYQLVLELAMMDLTNTAIIWQHRQQDGDGQIITVGSGSLLTNRMIAQADNRQFVINLMDYHLGPRGTVIFDDVHQGLSDIYDPEAFFADSRLHRTLYFIVGLWLLYVVGSSNRLLDPQPKIKVVKQSEFIEAIGGLINRRMTRSAVGLWMYKSWFNELRANMDLPLSGEPVWQEMNSMTLLDKRHISKMRRQYDLLTGKKSVNLIDLHNTLHEARKAIG